MKRVATSFWLAFICLLSAMLITGCSSGGSNNFIPPDADPDAVLEVLEDPIDPATAGASGDAIPLLGMSMEATDGDIELSEITFELGADNTADFTGVDLYLFFDTDGTNNVSKVLSAPNAGAGEILVGNSPQQVNLQGIVVFDLTGDNLTVGAGTTRYFWLYADASTGSFNPGDTIVISFSRLEASIVGGGLLQINADDNITSGNGLPGGGIVITGDLFVTNGPAHNNAGDQVIAQSSTPTDLNYQANLEANGENVTVTAITFTNTDPNGFDFTTDLTLANCRLMRDMNNDGAVDGGDTALDTGATATATTITFNPNITINDGANQNWIVELVVNANADGGNRIRLHVPNNADITATGGTSLATVVPDVSAHTAGGINRFIGSFATALTHGNGMNDPSTVVYTDTIDELILGFTVTASEENVTLTQFTFNPSGTGNDQNEVASFRVYRDDGDAAFDAGDLALPLGAATPFGGDNTATNFTVTGNGTVTLAQGAVQFWVAHTYDGATNFFAQDGRTFITQLDVSATTATGVASGQAVADTNVTDLDGGTHTAGAQVTLNSAGSDYNTTDNNASEILAFGFDATIDLLAVSANVQWTQVVLTELDGIVAAANFNAMDFQLYRDGGNNTYDAGAGDDVMVGAAVALTGAPNGTLTFNGFTETLTAGGTVRYWVGTNINGGNGALTGGDTFQFELNSVDFTLGGTTPAGTVAVGFPTDPFEGITATIIGRYTSAEANAPASADVFDGTTNAAAMGFTITTVDEAAQMNQVTIDLNAGSTGNGNDLVRVAVYVDSTADNLFNAANDRLVGENTSGMAGGTVTINTSAPGTAADNDIALNGSKQFWVVVDVDDPTASTLGQTFIVEFNVGGCTVVGDTVGVQLTDQTGADIVSSTVLTLRTAIFIEAAFDANEGNSYSAPHDGADVMVYGFTTYTSNDTAQIDDITLIDALDNGGFTSADFDNFQIYQDDGDGVYEPGTDDGTVGGMFSPGASDPCAVTLVAVNIGVNTTPATYWVGADLQGQADFSGGSTFQFSIADDTDVVASMNGVPFLDAEPLLGPTVAMTGSLTVAAANMPAAGTLHNDGTEGNDANFLPFATIAATGLTAVHGFSLQASTLEDLSLEELTLVFTFTGMVAADIDSVKLVLDDGDSTFNAADSVVDSAGFELDGVTVIFTNIGSLIMANNTNEYFIALDMNNANTALSGWQLSVSLTASSISAEGAESNDLIEDDFPTGIYGNNVGGNTHTIISYVTLVGIGNVDDRGIAFNTPDVLILGVTVTADNAGNVAVNGITLTDLDPDTVGDQWLAATMNVTNNTTVVYHDEGTLGTFEPGADDLGSGGALSWGNTNPDTIGVYNDLNDGGALSIVASSSATLWFACDVDNAATIDGNRMQAGIASENDLTMGTGDVLVNSSVNGGFFVITGRLDGTVDAGNTGNENITDDAVNQEMLQVQLEPFGEDVGLLTAAFTVTSTQDVSATVTSARLMFDNDDNGTYTVQFGTTNTFIDEGGGVWSFEFGGLQALVQASGFFDFQVEFTFNDTAVVTGVAAADYVVEFDEVNTQANGVASTHLVPNTTDGNDGGNKSVIEQLTVLDTDNEPAAGFVGLTDQNAQVFKLEFIRDAGNVTVTQIDLDVNYADVIADGDTAASTITRLELWLDDGDDAFEPGAGDTMVAQAAGSATPSFTGLSLSITATSALTPNRYFVSVDLNGTADVTDWLRVDLDTGNNGYITANGVTSTVADLASEPDTGGTVTVTGDPIQAGVQTIRGVFTAQIGGADGINGFTWHVSQQNAVLLQFNVKADGEAYDMTDLSIAMTFGGAMDQNDFTFAQIFVTVDANDDGVLDPGEAAGAIGSTGFAAGAFNWAGNLGGLMDVPDDNLTNGLNFLVFGNLGGTATPGETFRAAISASTSIEGDGAMSGATSLNPSGSYPITGFTQTVVARLLITREVDGATPTPIAANVLNDNDGNDLLMLNLMLQAVGENVTVSQLQFSDVGSADDLMDINQVRLYSDVDGDNVFEPGADDGAPIATSTYPADGDKVVFSGLALVAPTVGNIRVFVAYDLGGSASAAETFNMQMNGSADVTSTAASGAPKEEYHDDTDGDTSDNDLLAETQGNQTVRTGYTIVAGGNNPTARLPQPNAGNASVESAIMQIQVTVDNAGNLTFEDFDIDFAGLTGVTGDITDIEVLVDAATGGEYSPGAEGADLTQGAFGGFAGALATIDLDTDGGGTNHVINAGTTQTWWVVMNWAGTASPLETFPSDLTASSSFAITETSILRAASADITGATSTISFFADKTTPIGATLNNPKEAVAGDWVTTDNDGGFDVMFANTTIGATFDGGDGDGTFSGPQGPFAANTGINHAVSGDFNSDGTLDLMVANSSGATGYTVLLFDGAGAITTIANGTVSVAAPSGNPSRLCAGDFDCDGDIDAVAIIPSSSLAPSGFAIQFVKNNDLLNSMSGTMAGQFHVETATRGGDIGCADFDHDGDLDVAVSSATTNAVYIFDNDGAGVFSLVQTVSTTNGNTINRMCVGDVNGDGYADLVLTEQGGSKALEVLANTLGTFASLGDNNIGALFANGNPRAIACGDLNGDGDLDVVIANNTATAGDSDAHLFLGNGVTFTWAAKAETGGSATSIVDVELADFDRDGFDDVLLLGANNAATLHISNMKARTTSFSGANNVSPNSTDRGQLGDMDGDDDLDLVLEDQGNGSFYVVPNSLGTLAFGSSSSEAVGANWVTGSLRLADFDCDGDLDVLVLRNIAAGNNVLVVKLNDGSGGSFATLSINLTLTDNATTMTVGDIDDDGLVDVIVANDDDNLQVYQNIDGAGAVSAKTEVVTTNNATPIALGFGDFNQDGLGDVVALINEANDTLDSFLGDDSHATYFAGGVPVSNTLGENSAEVYVALVVCDFDRNGSLDVVAVDSNEGEIEAFIGDGNGGFTQPAGNFIEMLSANTETSVDVGDVNKDGFLDIIVGGNAAANTFDVVPGQAGADPFAAAVAVNLAGNDATGSTLAGDINQDGKVDVVTVEAGTADIAVFTNDGVDQ